ncbi:UNVERIFIED_CONTAM: hypothetical protein Sradi_3321900 [Sesamum radiatum]|uniref:Retrotransposon gag domain-containing protein n=1 Tax=Sesamum radiatum TaxID=300843 RepID=A0AAW2R1U6_SESRA
MAQNPERMIKEMTSLDLNQQPLCIEYPTLDVDFKLKTGLIRLLPTFRGLAGEDPHKHLKEFHVVCSGMRPQGVTEEQVKLRAFPFSLGEKAKDWLYSLPSGSIISWNELKKQFLDNYFPASRTITIRKEISGIRQFFSENFHEYWGRFKHLVESSPHHQISDHLLIQYLYEGLTETNRSLVGAASGDELTSLVKRLIVGNTQQVKACGMRMSSGYSTDACPTLHEEPTMHVNTVGGFSEPSQRGYDPFSKTYNPGWRDHPNLRYDNASQNFQKPPPPLQSNPNSGTSLEDMMKTLIANTQIFQQDTRTSIQNLDNQTRASIQNLESQVSQLASSVSHLESRGKLPYQTIINPKQNISGITLCSEKELQFENSTRRGHTLQNRTKNSVVRGQAKQGRNSKILQKKSKIPIKLVRSIPRRLCLNLPSRRDLPSPKKEEGEKEILETLRKVEVNIPLLDAIKQVPHYAKFLKEMCINKSKLRGNERINMGENVFTILQSKLPPKWKDPGTFSIPCKIGNIGIENVMCDLGASINVMSLAIYESLNIGPLKETGVVLQLADRSIVYPDGVLEDVLVQINELVFPVDFYVLDMIGDNSLNSTSILLGRPFLKTSRTKIDVDAGILSMEFDNEVPTSFQFSTAATATLTTIVSESTSPHRCPLLQPCTPLRREHRCVASPSSHRHCLTATVAPSSPSHTYHRYLSLLSSSIFLLRDNAS